MLDALLRRNLDLEFAERFDAADAAALVRPLPRALRGARRARHRTCCPARASAVAAVHAGSAVASIVVTAKYEPNALRCLEQVGARRRRGVRLALRRRQGRHAARRGRRGLRGRHAQRRAGGGTRRRAHGRGHDGSAPGGRAAGSRCGDGARLAGALPDWLCATTPCSADGADADPATAAPRPRAPRAPPRRHQDRPRCVSSTDVDASTAVALPLAHPSPRSCPRAARPSRVSPNESRRSASNDWSIASDVDALVGEQRPDDVLVGGQPGLEILQVDACRVAE